MGFDIDVAIFIGFLAVNLMVGLSHGRKIKTIKDYALGGRSFSTSALVSTIVATWLSGSLFFTDLTKTYSDGLYYLVPALCMSLSLIITSCFLIPRMGEFLGNISVAEAMGNMYGREVRIITAICGILGTIGGIAVQFKVFGNVFNYFLGVSSNNAIILASAIVILYSSFGGIKAVTYTDIIQFITFGFVVPLIGIIIWGSLYDFNISLVETLKTPQFNYKEIFRLDNPRLVEMVYLALYFAVPSVGSMDFQRISMGRTIGQVKKAWFVAAVLLTLMSVAIGWIPFLIKAIEPNLQSNQLVSYIIDNYSYPGLKGMIIIGIAAMAMSTADSRINAASVLFAYDIGEVFNIKMNPLNLSRVFSVLLGIASIYLALSESDLLNMVIASLSVYMPIVTVPLLLAIFGFRSTKDSVVIGMIAGFTVVSFFNFSGITANAIVLGMGANLVFFIGSHYLLKQKGGWVAIKDTRYLDEAKKERKRKISAFFADVKNFSFIEFCKNSSPKNELTYMWFGIYLIIYTLTTMYSTHVEMLRDKERVILTIYQMMMVSGVLLAMYPIWPTRIKREIIVQVAWNIIIFYMLIFFSCFFVMVSNFGQLQFAVFTLNIVMTAILVGWKLGLGMVGVGFLLSSQFYKFYANIDSLDVAIGSPQFILMYSLMLIGSTMIIILKPKEEQQDVLQTILQGSVRSEIFDANISSLVVLSNVGYRLNLESLNLSDLVYKRLETIRRIYEKNSKDRDFIFNIEENIVINGDKFCLMQLLDNLVMNAISHCKKGKVMVSLKKDNEGIKFEISDEGIAIPVNALHTIFGKVMVSSKTRTQSGYHVGELAFCKKIVESHGGSIKAQSDGIKGAKFTVILPSEFIKEGWRQDKEE